MPRESALVDTAVRMVIERGVTTKDIGGTSSTKEVGDAVTEQLGKLLQGS